MDLPDLPEWGAVDAIGLPTGCALGCDTALSAGRIAVPFGDRPDRLARTRMSEGEQALTSQGLPLDRLATGLGASWAPDGAWRVDTALVMSGQLDGWVERGPKPPDLAARAAWQPGIVSVGGSVWLDGLDNGALGVDLAVAAGHWTLASEVARQWITDVRRAFDGELDARQVRGDTASVRVERALGPRISAGTGLEGRVFVARDELAVSPWIRSVAALEYAVQRRLRWTVVEVADVAVLGPTDDELRISTRFDLRR